MSIHNLEKSELSISHRKLLAFISSIIGSSQSRVDEEHPLPPGPWDPVIRAVFKQINITSPSPEPWRIKELTFGHPVPWVEKLSRILGKHLDAVDGINERHYLADEVALNPQPLPPRITFLTSLAQAVISRAELLQEISSATAHEDEQRGIIIVGGYILRFTDDFCGTDFRLKYPFPGPRPHWFSAALDGIDLAVIAAQFDQAAREAFSPELHQHLTRASERLLEAGLLKIR